MIRCSTLHDWQCLCRQKCRTILIFQFLLSVRFSRNDLGKADTKVLVVRETPLHSSSVDLGNVSYCYTENSAKKIARQFARKYFSSVNSSFCPNFLPSEKGRLLSALFKTSSLKNKKRPFFLHLGRRENKMENEISSPDLGPNVSFPSHSPTTPYMQATCFA